MLTDIATCFQNRGLKNRNLRGEGGEGAESCSGHNLSLIITILACMGVRRWVNKGRTGRPSKDEKKQTCWGPATALSV